MASNNQLAKGYGEQRQWSAPFQLLSDTGAVMFAVDGSGNVTANGTLTGSGQVDSSGNATFAGTLAVTGIATFSGTLVLDSTASNILDLSAIGVSAAALKIAATTDTPSVTWSGSTGTHINNNAPAGYLKITVGASSRYIPFWA